MCWCVGDWGGMVGWFVGFGVVEVGWLVGFVDWRIVLGCFVEWIGGWVEWLVRVVVDGFVNCGWW